MKIIKEEFCCDECDTRIEQDGFPYDKDWIYVYNLSIQKRIPTIRGVEYDPMVDPLRMEEKDKHFCSEKCAIKFVTDIIKIKGVVK